MPVLNGSFERIAHRGAPRERVENTLPGFLLALERGATALELDAHVSADGRVVVHHDPVCRGREIARVAWAVLRDVDLGGGARMPLLEGVLDAVGDRAVVYIEVKASGAEDVIITTARAHGRRFALHSFDHASIARVAALAPDIARGVLLDRGTAGPVDAMRRAVDATGARDVWPHWRLVGPELVTAAREAGVRLLPWTVNSTRSARRLVAMGVAGVCTDDVRLLATV